MKQFHWAFGSPYFNRDNIPFGLNKALDKLKIDLAYCNTHPARMEKFSKRGERLHKKLMKHYSRM
jgi:hypothetical protein